jgi:hypothetical protein
VSETTIRAWKFLRDDCRSGQGAEGPWSVNERRDHMGALVLCESGYHSSPTIYDALAFAPGATLAMVEIPVPTGDCQQSDKQATRWLRVLAVRPVERELRLWGCDCAERALNLVEDLGIPVNPRSRQSLTVARRYADGQATREELAAARAAADAARAAAWAAAWAAEIDWQRARLDEMILS